MQSQYNEAKIVFSTNGVGTSGHLHARGGINESRHRPYKEELKMDNRPKYKTKTVKLLGDSIGENPDDLGYGDELSDTTSKAQSMKEIFDKLEFIKIENLYTTKDST